MTTLLIRHLDSCRPDNICRCGGRDALPSDRFEDYLELHQHTICYHAEVDLQIYFALANRDRANELANLLEEAMISWDMDIGREVIREYPTPYPARPLPK